MATAAVSNCLFTTYLLLCTPPLQYNRVGASLFNRSMPDIFTVEQRCTWESRLVTLQDTITTSCLSCLSLSMSRMTCQLLV